MHLQDADLLAVLQHMVDQLLCGVAHGTHRDDDVGRVRRTVVVERFVVGTDLLVDHLHIFVDDVRSFIVNGVARFSVLEECLRLLRRTHRLRMIRIQGVLLVASDRIPVHHGFQFIVIPCLDLLLFVRGSEPVKEMQHRKMSADGRQMSDGCQIHDLLNAVGSQHRKAGLTACHDVGMIAENIQRMGGYAAGRNMENSRRLLCRDFIHVRNHQQKTLRSRKRGRVRSGYDGAVNSACRTRFRFHFNDLDFFTKDVRSVLGNPFIHILSHWRGWRDRINSRNFRECVCYVSCCRVSVHCLEISHRDHSPSVRPRASLCRKMLSGTTCSLITYLVHMYWHMLQSSQISGSTTACFSSI